MNTTKGFWIIPNVILGDKELTSTQKLLYTRISSLSAAEWYCYALNENLGQFFGISKSAVSKNIKQLESKKHIFIEYKYKGKEIKARHIYITPPVKELIQGGVDSIPGGMVLKWQDNNIINNNINTNTEAVEKKPPAVNANTLSADGIYKHYISFFPTGKKRHKKSVSLDRIKQELKRSSEAEIMWAINNYIADKKETIRVGDYQYMKSCENFFWYEPWTRVKFIDDLKGDWESQATMSPKALQDTSNDDLVHSVNKAGSVNKWKNENRQHLIDLKTNNIEEFNRIKGEIDKIVAEENKNLYL